MAVSTVAGTVTNASGQVSNFTGTIDVTAPTPPPVQPPVVTSVVVTPQSAPQGTQRTITITAHDVNSPAQALSYTCTVNGVAATPTGQPNVFTVVA